MKRFAIPALLAAVIVAALATAVWSGSGRADACSRLITRVVHGYWATMWISCEGVSPWDLFDQDTSGEARFGSWLYDVHGNLIPGDAVRPGVVEEYNSSGPRSLGVYVGDRVRTPWVDANDRLRWSVSEVAVSYGHNTATGAQYITTPQRPAVSTDDVVFYSVGSSHRAVRGADGNCYREERARGGWQRSGSYGDDDEACRRASINAYIRSQGETTIDPTVGTFPSGSLPAVGVSQTLVSNTGRSRDAAVNLARDYGQEFTTGIHKAGYRVTAIGFLIATLGNPGHNNWDLELWSSSGTQPGELLATLTKPSSMVDGVNTFTVPDGGIDLDPETTYWVVLDMRAGSSWFVRRTSQDIDDPGGSLGWSIADQGRYRDGINNSGYWRSGTSAYFIQITGAPK